GEKPGGTPGDRSRVEDSPSCRRAANIALGVPDLVGKPLPRALARLRKIKRAAGPLDRGCALRRFEVEVETVIAGPPDELVVSGQTPSPRRGDELPALVVPGATVTLYAVPADRYEQDPPIPDGHTPRLVS
ncbi:MAG TPA: hypothetical protein VKA36_02545, partial [Solirubrobacterales bacterium]|nr:hypothetical protein [Solirubrobacterales bacterium]